MSIETDLYAHLSTHTGLTALVNTRIYPLQAPADVPGAFCVFSTVSRVRQYSHQGYSNLDRCRVQISCFAKTYAAAHAIAAQVTAAMDAWKSANTSVQACLHDGEQDFYEEESQYYHVPLDFIVWYG